MTSETPMYFTSLDEKVTPTFPDYQNDPTKPPEYPGPTYNGQRYDVAPPYPNPPPIYPVQPPYPSGQVQPPYPSGQIQSPYPTTQPPQQRVRSYLCWSITNLLFGWIVCGVVAVIFSVRVIRYRDRQNYYRAHRYRKLALITNIIGSILTTIVWIAIIASLALSNRRTR